MIKNQNMSTLFSATSRIFCFPRPFRLSLTARRFSVYIPRTEGGRKVVVNAPAKVNLHLEVRDLLPGGHHEILSIVHKIPLFDRIELRSLKERHALRILCIPPVSGGQNIACSAVQIFRKSCGIDTGVEVRIEKSIPVGAGLGGGSSDAAAVLGGLNELFADALSTEQLHELAAGLGSDVSFFLHGPAALMSGRGEVIQDLVPRDDFMLVLVYPGFSISTAAAYRWFDEDEDRDRRSAHPEDLKVQFEEKPPASWSFFNSFQATMERRYPLIREIIGELAGSGAHPAVLSGSGSSVVGVFTDSRAARTVHRSLKRRFPAVWLLEHLQSRGFTD
jgi:4-diphosphocytidyl-2-C-methyl-D-erythritol kinase